MGLRNPFRMSFRPGTNAFYVNDVGQTLYEEVNVGAAGADYGWSCFEGNTIFRTTGLCATTPSGTTPPLYFYDHTGRCAITGSSFAGGNWPAGYGDAYYFSDYCSNTIYRLTNSGAVNVTDFAVSQYNVVAMRFDVADSALLYTSGSGLRRIRYIGNLSAPIARASASPTSGGAPLTVNFDGRASSDPAGLALSASWIFGDGGAGSGLQTSHSYGAAGNYTAQLIVRNSAGVDSAPVTVQIVVNNASNPPVITSPPAGYQFRVGEVLTLSGSATDGSGNPVTDLRWTVLLHHVSASNPGTEHVHPFFAGNGNNLVIPAAPQHEDLDAAAGSYLEIQLNSVDATGTVRSAARNIDPQRVTVGVSTNPSGLPIEIDLRNYTAPQTFTSWAGATLNLNAPANAVLGGQALSFQSWSDGGAASHNYIVPAGGGALSAAYTAQVGGGGTPVHIQIYTPAYAPLAGWPVTAENLTIGGAITQGTTNASGDATLSLAPASYRFCQVLQPGYVNTFPGSNCYYTTIGGNPVTQVFLNQVSAQPSATSPPAATATPTVTPGPVATNTSAPPTSTPSPLPTSTAASGTAVRVSVYTPAYAPLAGWTITAFNSNSSALSTATTNNNGDALFTLPPGPYVICQTLQPGYGNTYPGGNCYYTTIGANAITQVFLNQPTVAATATTPATPQPTPTQVQLPTTTPAGLPVSLVVNVWDAGFNGLTGWTVTVRDLATNVMRQGLTDVDGIVSFALPVAEYDICVVLQSGWTNSHPGTGCYSWSLAAGSFTANFVNIGGAATATPVIVPPSATPLPTTTRTSTPPPTAAATRTWPHRCQPPPGRPRRCQPPPAQPRRCRPPHAQPRRCRPALRPPQPPSMPTA